ncbi:glycosyl transferase family protein [Flavobacterium limnosediminis JC2902]|uniref:Glycosyl transferase family protein n=1 Tax=Flavobacterium limnosediminis JC2902 TaxID=1341181 RepID=V6STU0_9FLAO|nr:glycosyltransferase family 2 protein [Flavobacterium limnosediminis]ESU29874.1 glycosyl transferase family protein [Flavobacterium limnosediminis JC2902]
MEIAILIPCLNEELTIERVVNGFKKELPNSTVYVYDNNSNDDTFKIASEANAVVKKEFKKGKANVILRMFNEIEADIYVMIDGDDTYPIEAIHSMIALLKEQNADMIIGDRISNGAYKNQNKRKFHNFGNSLIKTLINSFFKTNISDVLSGYRVFSRRFVKNYASSIKGFELETDLTLFCLNYDLKIDQFPINYKDRPPNSKSKLNTFNDGFKVITLFLNLYRLYKPLQFFSTISLCFAIFGLGLGYFPIREYIVKPDHYITKVPTAILAVSLIIMALLLFCCGLILDNLSKYDKRNFKQILLNSK